MIQNSYQLKFDHRHLRSFLVIADEMSFRKAAKVLHIAQPALSRQIAQLEEAIGGQLFDRSARKIELTEAGRFLYAKLPRILEQLNHVIDDTKMVVSGRSTCLRFGYSSAAMSSFLPGVIKSLRNELNNCEIYFEEETSDELIKGVLQDHYDAAFILFRPKQAGLKTIPVRSEQIGVILPDDHKLVNKKEIHLKDLKDERFILFPRNTNPVMFDNIIYFCKKARFTPNITREVTPRSKAIALVAAGEGIATIAESLNHTCIKGTVYRPLVQPGPQIEYSCILKQARKEIWSELLSKIMKKIQ